MERKKTSMRNWEEGKMIKITQPKQCADVATKQKSKRPPFHLHLPLTRHLQHVMRK